MKNEVGWVKCYCDYMINFVVFFFVFGLRKYDEKNVMVLLIIFYVGCVILLVGFIFILMMYVLFRFVKVWWNFFCIFFFI